jgi:hypothetical protein
MMWVPTLRQQPRGCEYWRGTCVLHTFTLCCRTASFGCALCLGTISARELRYSSARQDASAAAGCAATARRTQRPLCGWSCAVREHLWTDKRAACQSGHVHQFHTSSHLELFDFGVHLLHGRQLR